MSQNRLGRNPRPYRRVFMQSCLPAENGFGCGKRYIPCVYGPQPIKYPPGSSLATEAPISEMRCVWPAFIRLSRSFSRLMRIIFSILLIASWKESILQDHAGLPFSEYFAVLRRKARRFSKSLFQQLNCHGIARYIACPSAWLFRSSSGSSFAIVRVERLWSND